MPVRVRIRRALALALALLLVPAALARGDAAYDRVVGAYTQGGGTLDACAFSKADLQAALDGIPAAIRNVVPDVRRAIRDAIKAHDEGRCKGRTPTGAAVAPTATSPATPAPGTATTPTVPDTATPGTTTAPATGTPATTTPGAVTPGASSTPATTTPAAASTGAGHRHHTDTKPLVIAGIAVGALLALALLTWWWAWLRGWDPAWTKTWRHAWGEAGYRTTTTWSEFTDWLRLGR